MGTIKKTFIEKLNHSSTKYFLVGIAAFFIDYVVLLFLYYVLNLNLEVATAIGFIVGFTISFTANRQWVFSGSHKKRVGRQMIEYTLLVVFNFVFTVWSVNLLNNHGLTPTIGKLVIMGLIMCWNYALFRWVIFAAKSESED